MKDIVICLVSGATGAALISFVQFLIQRRDKKNEKESVERQALRYIMLYIIQERAKEMLAEGKTSVEELRVLRQWHQVYHEGLGGNGDADELMKSVGRLPMDLKKKEDI